MGWKDQAETNETKKNHPQVACDNEEDDINDVLRLLTKLCFGPSGVAFVVSQSQFVHHFM